MVQIFTSLTGETSQGETASAEPAAGSCSSWADWFMLTWDPGGEKKESQAHLSPQVPHSEQKDRMRPQSLRQPRGDHF